MKQTNQTVEEDLSTEIESAVKKIRSIRWKIDQALENNEIDPIFKEHYRTYTREEFLYDANLRVGKIASLLDCNEDELKCDPKIRKDREKIMNMYNEVEIHEDNNTAYFNSEGLYNWDIDLTPPKNELDDMSQDEKKKHFVMHKEIANENEFEEESMYGTEDSEFLYNYSGKAASINKNDEEEIINADNSDKSLRLIADLKQMVETEDNIDLYKYKKRDSSINKIKSKKSKKKIKKVEAKPVQKKNL